MADPKEMRLLQQETNEKMKDELKKQDIRLNKLCFDYYEKDKRIEELEEENNKLLDVINNQDVKIADLEKQIEKLKADLNEAIEDANRWEETETFSVLNRIYNDNF